MGGKGLVQLDHIHLVKRQTCARQQFAGRRDRAYTHDARGNTSRRHADHPGQRRGFFCRRLIAQQQGRGPIIHTRGIACGHCLVRAVDALQFRQFFGICSGAGMFICLKDNRITLALRDLDREDFIGKDARLLSCRKARLRARGKSVLICAADAKILGNIIRRFGH